MSDLNSMDNFFCGPLWEPATDERQEFEANLDIFSKAIGRTGKGLVSAWYSDEYFPSACLHGGRGESFTLQEVNPIVDDFLANCEGMPIVSQVSNAIRKSCVAFAKAYPDDHMFIGSYSQWQDFLARHGNAGNKDCKLNDSIAQNGANELLGQLSRVDLPLKLKVGKAKLSIPLGELDFAYHRRAREGAQVVSLGSTWVQVNLDGPPASLSEVIYFLCNLDQRTDLVHATESPFREPARRDESESELEFMPPMLTIFGTSPNGDVNYASFILSQSQGTIISIRKNRAPTAWAKILATSPIVKALFSKAR